MRTLTLVVFSLALSIFAACGDSDDGGTSAADTGGGSMTLSEQLTALGLEPGNYAVGNNGAALCSITYNYPGSPPVTENQYLAGYQTFELRVDDEDRVVTIRGDHDDLTMRWSDSCLRWEAGTDELTNHSACEEDECTPFNEVRVCVGEESPTFFGQIPECGHNTFPIARQ